MAAFISVTDSLTGEPVAVNVDQVLTLRTRKGEDRDTTIIDFGQSFVQCTESMARVATLIMRAVTPD
jgi:hypothetical protein